MGPWFHREFERLGFLQQHCRILDIGCGCGRVAYTLAINPDLRERKISYTGMDVDCKSIEWCCDNIAPLNPRFSFLYADLSNRAYNPMGTVAATDYVFPFKQESFDLILLTSVLTHLMESELTHYLNECYRMLSPHGNLYASFFLFHNERELRQGLDRHPVQFKNCHGCYATVSRQTPEAAVAYQEHFVMELVHSIGFCVANDIMYGTQDIVLLKKD